MQTYQEIWEELRAIQHTMNVARTWAGNPTALQNIDKREIEIARVLSSFKKIEDSA